MEADFGKIYSGSRGGGGLDSNSGYKSYRTPGLFSEYVYGEFLCTFSSPMHPTQKVIPANFRGQAENTAAPFHKVGFNAFGSHGLRRQHNGNIGGTLNNETK
uniref:Uncharacterized protein n=1 Tax=Micrurus spixii TaxID=129469 RepID=A0A2D4LSZ6_9SAUR